jgi:Zn-dependent alcohol dehydrogenase
MATQRITKALVSRTYGEPLSLETLHVSAPGAKEVLVEMHATGICHTDLMCMKAPFPTPYILGHEGTLYTIYICLDTRFSFDVFIDHC